MSWNWQAAAANYAAQQLALGFPQETEVAGQWNSQQTDDWQTWQQQYSQWQAQYGQQYQQAVNTGALPQLTANDSVPPPPPPEEPESLAPQQPPLFTNVRGGRGQNFNKGNRGAPNRGVPNRGGGPNQGRGGIIPNRGGNRGGGMIPRGRGGPRGGRGGNNFQSEDGMYGGFNKRHSEDAGPDDQSKRMRAEFAPPAEYFNDRGRGRGNRGYRGGRGRGNSNWGYQQPDQSSYQSNYNQPADNFSSYANKPFDSPKPPPPTKPAVDPKAKAEEEHLAAIKAFDEQFKQWEDQFNSWKEENKHHPDTNQYNQYESKWESWRQQLLARRESMMKSFADKSKENETAPPPTKPAPTAKPTGFPSPGSKPPQEMQSLMNRSGPPNTQRPPQYATATNTGYNTNEYEKNKQQPPPPPPPVQAKPLISIKSFSEMREIIKPPPPTNPNDPMLITLGEDDCTFPPPPPSNTIPGLDFEGLAKKDDDDDDDDIDIFAKIKQQLVTTPETDKPFPFKEKAKESTDSKPSASQPKEPLIKDAPKPQEASWKPAQPLLETTPMWKQSQAQDNSWKPPPNPASLIGASDPAHKPGENKNKEEYDQFGNLIEDYEQEHYKYYEEFDKYGNPITNPPGDENYDQDFSNDNCNMPDGNQDWNQGNRGRQGDWDQGNRSLLGRGRGQDWNQEGRSMLGRGRGQDWDQDGRNMSGRGRGQDWNQENRNIPGRGRGQDWNQETRNMPGRGRGQDWNQDERNRPGRGNRPDQDWNNDWRNQKEYWGEEESWGDNWNQQQSFNRGRGGRGRGGNQRGYQDNYGQYDDYEQYGYDEYNQCDDRYGQYEDQYDDYGMNRGGRGGAAFGRGRGEIARGRSDFGRGRGTDTARGRGGFGRGRDDMGYEEESASMRGGSDRGDIAWGDSSDSGRSRSDIGRGGMDGSRGRGRGEPRGRGYESARGRGGLLRSHSGDSEFSQNDDELKRKAEERGPPIDDRRGPAGEERSLRPRGLMDEDIKRPDIDERRGGNDHPVPVPAKDDDLFGAERRQPAPIRREPDNEFKPSKVVDYLHLKENVPPELSFEVNSALPAPVDIPTVIVSSNGYQEPSQTFDYGHGITSGITARNTETQDNFNMAPYNSRGRTERWEEDRYRRYWMDRDRDRDNIHRDRDRERDRDRDRYDRDPYDRYGRHDQYDRGNDRGHYGSSRPRDDSPGARRFEGGRSRTFPRRSPTPPPQITKTEKEVFPIRSSAKKPEEIPDENLTPIEELLCLPGRVARPSQIAIFIRGPPGSGKSYLAKLIKEKEVENGGHAPRILSLDDYFMTEKEELVKNSETGKTEKKKVMEYEYEAEMEVHYRASLAKAFKKTIDDGFFQLVILDCINEKMGDFDELWNYAKQKGFQTYIADMDAEANVCAKRNEHHRSLQDIEKIIKNWEPTPKSFQRLNVRALLNAAILNEVEAEELSDEEFPADEPETSDTTNNNQNPPPDNDEEDDSNDAEVELPSSKWETMEHTEEKLDRLDGLKIKKRHSEPRTMEDFLQLADDYESKPAEPGKKRVSWADVEERKQQERMRAIGFVVGQTDWSRMTDPTFGESALTKYKYI